MTLKHNSMYWDACTVQEVLTMHHILSCPNWTVCICFLLITSTVNNYSIYSTFIQFIYLFIIQIFGDEYILNYILLSPGCHYVCAGFINNIKIIVVFTINNCQSRCSTINYLLKNNN
jgi:hypothetical protein